MVQPFASLLDVDPAVCHAIENYRKTRETVESLRVANCQSDQRSSGVT